MLGHSITRREVILLVVLSLLFGLFLQFDLSLRFTDASGSDSLLGVKLGFGRTSRDEWYDGRPDRAGDRWLDDVVEAGANSHAGNKVAGMTESKLHWTVSGAPITEVLAHAPGESVFLCAISLRRGERQQMLMGLCRVDDLRPGVSVQGDVVHCHG